MSTTRFLPKVYGILQNDTLLDSDSCIDRKVWLQWATPLHFYIFKNEALRETEDSNLRTLEFGIRKGAKLSYYMRGGETNFLFKYLLVPYTFSSKNQLPRQPFFLKYTKIYDIHRQANITALKIFWSIKKLTISEQIYISYYLKFLNDHHFVQVTHLSSK